MFADLDTPSYTGFTLRVEADTRMDKYFNAGASIVRVTRGRGYSILAEKIMIVWYSVEPLIA